MRRQLKNICIFFNSFLETRGYSTLSTTAQTLHKVQIATQFTVGKNFCQICVCSVGFVFFSFLLSVHVAFLFCQRLFENTVILSELNFIGIVSGQNQFILNSLRAPTLWLVDPTVKSNSCRHFKTIKQRIWMWMSSLLCHWMSTDSLSMTFSPSQSMLWPLLVWRCFTNVEFL